MEATKSNFRQGGGIIQEGGDYEHAGQHKDVYTEDEVVLVPCPMCGSENRERIATEHGAIGTSQCLDCSLIYTSPRLKSPEQVYWGDPAKWLAEGRLIFAGKAPHHRDPNYEEELRFIQRHKPQGRFLDVGSNIGSLLRKVREMGWQAFGVEPSPPLAKIAREQLGLEIYNCFLADLPKELEHSFDVVAFSDVFEHVTEPLAFLADARRFLAPDGVLYVKVPNGRWNLFKQQVLNAMGRHPSRGVWDSYEHVVQYTDETLRQMLEKGGFEILDMMIGKPVQLPVWHEFVGHYYQYPSPWYLDWKRHAGRSLFYWAARMERAMRGGRIGPFAPNIAAVARAR